MMKKGYTNLENEIFFDELSDAGTRMLMLIKHLLDVVPGYEISRLGIEHEWKKLKGHPARRTFIRAWNELKQMGYLFKFNVKKGGKEGFGCNWGIRSGAEARNWREKNDSKIEVVKAAELEEMPCAQNEKAQEETNTSCEENIRLNKETKKTKDSLMSKVQEIFDSYVTAKCKTQVKIRYHKLNYERIVKGSEITSRFLECQERGIVQEVIRKVTAKISSYIDNIKYKNSYITAAIFNTIKEYSTLENSSAANTNVSVSIPTYATTMPTNTKFHNFEQRNTDYDALLRQLNPSYI